MCIRDRLQTLEVLDKHPERIAQLPGIGASRAERIAESYAEQVEVQGAMIFLQGLDLTAAMSMKIYRAFGAASPELIRERCV